MPNFIVRCEAGPVIGFIVENSEGWHGTAIAVGGPATTGTRHTRDAAVEAVCASVARAGLDPGHDVILQPVEAILTALPIPPAAARRRIPISRAL